MKHPEGCFGREKDFRCEKFSGQKVGRSVEKSLIELEPVFEFDDCMLNALYGY